MFANAQTDSTILDNTISYTHIHTSFCRNLDVKALANVWIRRRIAKDPIPFLENEASTIWMTIQFLYRYMHIGSNLCITMKNWYTV